MSVTGFVTQKKNSWYIVIREASEKQRWLSVRKELGHNPTKKDAETLLKKMLWEAEQRGGTLLKKSGSLGEFIEKWMDLRRADLKDNTYNNYMRIFKNHVLSYDIANLPITKVSTFVIQKFIGTHKATDKMKHYVITLLGTVFDAAIEWGVIDQNPIRHTSGKRRIKLPAIKPPEQDIWTDTDIERFFNRVKGRRLELFWKLAISTGMRRGELLGLHWTDIDFNKAIIKVRRSLGPNRVLQDYVKSFKGYRDVPLPQHILDELKARRIEAAALNGFIFTTRTGQSYDPDSVLNQLKTWCVKAQVPEADIHSFRHIFISKALAAGIDNKTLMEIVGHSDYKTTMRYAHTSREQKAQAITMIQERLQECGIG